MTATDTHFDLENQVIPPVVGHPVPASEADDGGPDDLADWWVDLGCGD